MAHQFHGKTALITGASTGIGRGIARGYHAAGGNVVIADINEDKGAQLSKELGERAIFVPCDVTQEAAIAECINGTVEAFGRLDFLVNNAGADGFMGSLRDVTEEHYRKTTDLLLFAVLMGTKHAIPHLSESGGSIINISSTTGVMADSQSIIYAIAKAAVIHLTKASALQLGGENIRVNAIAPGLIATPMYSALIPGFDEEKAADVAKLSAYFEELHPINKIGVPSDIAEAALFLASDAARFITGQTLIVDGGATLSCPTESQSVMATLQSKASPE